MKKILPVALSTLVLALAAGSAHAQVVNGGFNGLAGWTTGGDAASVGGDHLVLTTSSSLFPDDDAAGLAAGARNVSGAEPLVAGGGLDSLEEFLGVDAHALNPDEAHFVYAVEGSAASQTFTAAAGSRLSFQFDLSTLDQRDPTQADVAFVVIDGQVTRLADAFAANLPVADGSFAAQTGWLDFAATFATGGSHTVSFGIVDVGDYNATSALSVANVGVAVSAVPETSSLALMAAGLAMLALQRRRRKA